MNHFSGWGHLKDNYMDTSVHWNVYPEIRRPYWDLDENEPSNFPAKIGVNNILREGVVVSQGEKRNTLIGNNCYIMAYAHIGHDVQIGDNVTIGSKTTLAGYVTVEDDVTFGLHCCVHQGLTIGKGAMIGMGSVVTHDVPPYTKVYGNPARVHGINYTKFDELNIDEQLKIRNDLFNNGITDLNYTKE